MTYIRYAYLLLFLLFWSLTGISQPLETIDSLKKELIHSKKEDTGKVYILYMISNILGDAQPDSGLVFANQCLELSQKLDWHTGVGLAKLSLGKIYLNKSRQLQAIQTYNEAISEFTELNDKILLAKSYALMALAYGNMSNTTKSIENNFKALTLYEEQKDKKGIAVVSNNLGLAYNYIGQQDKALQYYQSALKINEETGDKNFIAANLHNIGQVYQQQGKLDEALDYFRKAEAINKQTNNINYLISNLNEIGLVHQAQHKYHEALSDYTQAINFGKEVNIKVPAILGNIGATFVDMYNDRAITQPDSFIPPGRKAQLAKGIAFINDAINDDKETGAIEDMQSNYWLLSVADSLYGDCSASQAAYKQHIRYRDSVMRINNRAEIANIETERELSLKDKQIEIDKLEVAKKNNARIFYIVAIGLLIVVVVISLRNVSIQARTNKLLTAEKKRSDDLLLNILPEEVAEELKMRGEAEAKYFDNVTVLFTDFVNFTKAAERMTPKTLIGELHACFKAFDEIVTRHNIEKIKTIGDAYLAVGGLPVPDTEHAEHVVAAAIEIARFMKNRKKELNGQTFDIRIGIHSGSVVAGIVGVKKFAYDIWGDTVNTASRLQQNSEPGKINISQTTWELVRDKISWEYRGELDAKNKGLLNMYFVVTE